MRHSMFCAVALAGLALLTGCADEESPVVAATVAFNSTDTTMASRGVEVPITLVTPAGGDDEAYPLVVLAHGHGGSRWEGGAFPAVAEALALKGIASIRMDFPGCGDSTESFAENNLSNMLLDIKAARAFAVDNTSVDPERIGLLGYSMGGRLASLAAAKDPDYAVMAIWAPAVENGAARERKEFELLGGEGYYDTLRATAEKEGEARYTTRWGSELNVGLRWFTDLESTQPLEAIAEFTGPILVLYGDADDVVPPSTAEAAIAAATGSSEVVRHVVSGAEHGLGFYTNRPAIAAEVVATTVDFLSERL